MKQVLSIKRNNFSLKQKSISIAISNFSMDFDNYTLDNMWGITNKIYTTFIITINVPT